MGSRNIDPRRIAFGLVLLSFLIGIRFYAISSDPPAGVHYHFHADEGWWAHNARLHALFGEWTVEGDEQATSLAGAPAYAGSLAIWYKMFGVGLAETRALAALCGVATCLVLGLLISRTTTLEVLPKRTCPAEGTFGGKTSELLGVGAFAVVLYGCSYFVATLQRLALPENVASLLLTIGLTILGLNSGSRLAVTASAAVLALAAFIKFSFLPYLVVPLIFFATQFFTKRRRSERLLRDAVLYLGALVLSVGVLSWFQWTYWLVDLPDARKEILGLAALGALGGESSGPALANVVRFGANGVGRILSIGLHSEFEPQMSGLLSGGPAFVVLFLVAAISPRARLKNWRRIEWLLVVWLAVGVVGSMVVFPWDRRLVTWMIPMAGLIAIWLQSPFGRQPVRVLFVVAGLAWLYLRPMAAATLHGQFGFLNIGNSPGIGPRASAALAGVLVGVVVVLLSLLLLRYTAWGKWRPHVPVAALLALFILVEPTRLAVQLSQPTFDQRDMGRALAAQDQSAAQRIVGLSADALALENGSLPLLVRRAGSSPLNLDAVDRLKPEVILFTRIADFRPTKPIEEEDPRGRPGYEFREEFSIRPERRGQPRFVIEKWVRVDRH